MLSASPASPEMSITMGYRRPQIVLDPWLCLDGAGPFLIQRLQHAVELWIVRELWHILDNSHFYGLRPEALLAGAGAGGEREAYRLLLAKLEQADQDLPSAGAALTPAPCLQQALRLWERIRLSRDLSGLKLFWLGDGLFESMLPDGSVHWLHAAHEHLVASLDAYLAPRSPIACGQRDAVALALALGGVPVLSLMDTDSHTPALCRRLFADQVECRPVPLEDPVAQLERETWMALLVHTNCAPLLWNGLRLALVHVHANAILATAPNDDEPPAPAPEPEGWAQTKVYWYAL